MKKHIKIPCFLCLSLASVSSLGLISCNDENHVSSQPKITGPQESTINLVHFSTVDSTLLKGFSYEGITNPSNIIIQNTFTQGIAVFKTKVSNISLIHKTFDIEIVAYDAQPQELTGVLSFYYEDQLIADAPTTAINLNILKTPVVGDQFDKVKTIQLNPTGVGECIFENFSIENTPNLQELLDYKVDFVQAGTYISTELIFVDDAHFNLKVRVTSAVQGTIQGGISFQYNKHNIAITGSNILTINILAPQSIDAPAQTDYVLETSQKEGQLVIPGFTFTSIEEDNIDVYIHTLDNVVLSASIVNWETETNTFAVQVAAQYDTFCDFTFSLSFKNKTTQEPFEYEGHDFNITTNSIVPRSMLNIVETQSAPTRIVSLNGFNSESITELQESGYNTLLIPNDVTEIANEAFKQTPVTSLKNLKFASNSSLLTIGNNAFDHDDFFDCDLVIPYSVTFIGSHAFQFCQKLRSLTFENVTRTITIKQEAFKHCTGLRGDLRLPSTTKLSDFLAFGFSWFDGTLYFPPNLIDDGEGLGTSFSGMINLKNIDISVYTDIPEWMGPGRTKCEFNRIGESAQGPKLVLYNKNLIASKLETIKQYFYDHELPDDFTFVEK